MSELEEKIVRTKRLEEAIRTRWQLRHENSQKYPNQYYKSKKKEHIRLDEAIEKGITQAPPAKSLYYNRFSRSHIIWHGLWNWAYKNELRWVWKSMTWWDYTAKDWLKSKFKKIKRYFKWQTYLKKR